MYSRMRAQNPFDHHKVDISCEFLSHDKRNFTIVHYILT